MPGKVKVKIIAGRNLPIMDRSNDTTDAYVEVKLGSTTFKTDVCRKSLNPQWNSEWFRFEMDDLELQDEPLQIRLMDHDTYSANDAIGKVYLDLNPLLLTSSKGKDSAGKLISGWIPVYDTMHGIRGEVNLIVKVELFSDLNKFRQSSCGVMFFFTQAIPDGYFAHSLHGFVEELVVNDDPEYQWIDKIRTPRASNEARQTLFSKLSGEVQRRVGLKALELGGNAVVGYRQCFDLEGESGIVVRGIGTAATLIKQYENQLSPTGPDSATVREFQSLEDGVLLPFSSHPSKLSKPSRSQCTGSRVAISTLSMPETLLTSRPNYFNQSHSAPSSSSVVTNIPMLNFPGDLHVDNAHGVACSNVKNASENESVFRIDPTACPASPVPASVDLENFTRAEHSNAVKGDVDGKFETETVGDGDIAKENNFARLLMQRKPRGSRKKDRYSKSSLVKRASDQVSDSKQNLGSSKGKDFTEEIVKFFKRKRNMLNERLETTSLTESPYRSVKSSLFRRRLIFRSSLHRCNSESYSLGQTSLDSLPSVQSDIVLDMETHSNSLGSLDSDTGANPNRHSIPNRESIGTEAYLNHPNCEIQKLQNAIDCVETLNSAAVTKKHDFIFSLGNDSSEDSIPIEMTFAEELGYGMENSVNSFVLGSDALLVMTSADIDCRNKTDTTNITANNFQAEVSCDTLLTGGSSSKKGNSEQVGNPKHVSKEGIPIRYTSSTIHQVDVHAEKQASARYCFKDSAATSRKIGAGQFSENSKVNNNVVTVEVSQENEEVRQQNTSYCQGFLNPFEFHDTNVKPAVRLRSLGSPVHCRIINHSRSFSDGSGSEIKCQCRACVSQNRLAVCNTNCTSLATKSNSEYWSHANPNLHDKDTKTFSASSNRSLPNNSKHLVQPRGVTKTSTTLSKVRSSNTASTSCATTSLASTGTVVDTSTNISLRCLTNAYSTNSPPVVPAAPPFKAIQNATTSMNRSSVTATGNSVPHPQAKPGNQIKIGIAVSAMNRRSSESDLSSPPKSSATNTTTVTTVMASSSHGKTLTFAPMPARRLITADHFEMLEYPFITLNQLPSGFIQHLGGTVSARSVKLLERISNLDEPESRDSWWTEIRMEIRSHARSIGCNIVLGYEEQTTMCDDVCILSASGTAALVSSTLSEDISTGTKVPCNDCAGVVTGQTRPEKEKAPTLRTDSMSSQQNGCAKCCVKMRHISSESSEQCCQLCHIPYNESSVPFPVKMTRCLLCKKGKVPDILLATIDLPAGLQTCGKSCLIQAQVFRPKKDCKGEISAKEVSDSLPFLEYELHRRLINKLKVRGMNAIFALQVQICLGEKLMVGLATGTAVYLSCLPPPSVPKISAGNLKTDAQKVVQFQKVVQEVFEKNREVYNLKNTVPVINGTQSLSSDGEESEEDLPDIDLATGNKDTYVLEVDDAEDIDIIQVLIDPSPELGFYMNNINFLHGFENYQVTSQQMFTQVWRCRISPLITLRQFTNYFDKLLQAVAFKLRRISPCVLSKLRYRVELPEQDEMQLSIIGLAVKIEENSQISSEHSVNSCTVVVPDISDVHEEVPPLNQVPTPTVATSPTSVCLPGIATESVSTYLKGTTAVACTAPVNSSVIPGPVATKAKGFLRSIHIVRRPKCIEITPLSHIPGGKIDKYLGNLNFFFIRETTSIREIGGLSGFVHSFIAEVLAIVRAHVAALGGNAMVSYFMTELALLHNPHKNQGQCLVNVGGDVVLAVYPGVRQEV